ncbi:hypothetical protein ACS0X5_04130 [Burkholderia gladioli]|uniref:hypothetical protein n=1 Tax=Burkholderia gladioli TaxID=28095 RepID=UPI003F798E19
MVVVVTAAPGAVWSLTTVPALIVRLLPTKIEPPVFCSVPPPRLKLALPRDCVVAPWLS